MARSSNQNQCSPIDESLVVGVPVSDFEVLFCHKIPLQSHECVDLILVVAKNSIYSKKSCKIYRRMYMKTD